MIGIHIEKKNIIASKVIEYLSQVVKLAYREYEKWNYNFF